MMMGTDDMRRIVRHTSKPSMPGSITSRTTMSGPSARSSLNPSSALFAVETSNPLLNRYTDRRPQSLRSSSITRTRALMLCPSWQASNLSHGLAATPLG